MKLGLDVRVADPAWNCRIPDIRALCRRAADAALSEIGAASSPDGIAILLTCDSEMSNLNACWRGVDRPTNVLSLASATGPDQEGITGDIALAFGTIAREADASGVRMEDHLAHLVVHGILHLAGHDHRLDDEAERMEDAESRVLVGLGVADPYAVSAVREAVQ